MDEIDTPPLTLAQALAAGGVTLPLHLGHEEIGDVIDDTGRLVLTTDVGHRRTDREVISTAALVVAAVNACGGHPAGRAQTPAAVPAGYGMCELEDVRVACLARVDAAAQRADFTPWQRAFAAHLVAEISSSIKGLSLPVGHRPNGPPHPPPAQEPVAFVDMQFITKSRAMTTDLDREAFEAWWAENWLGTPHRKNEARKIWNAGAAHAREAGAQEPVAADDPKVVAIARPIFDFLWPELGGSHQPAEFWQELSDCVCRAIATGIAAPVSPPADHSENTLDMVKREKRARALSDLAAADAELLTPPPAESGETEAAIQEIERLVYGGQHNGGTSLARAVKMIRAALASTPDPQPGRAVKVKALEWVEAPPELPTTRFVAKSEVRTYYVREDAWRTDGCVWLAADDLDAAKAAAQADYERRILSALEPPPSGWDAGAFEAGAKAMREEIAKAFKARAPKLSGPHYEQASWVERSDARLAAKRAHANAEFVRALPLPSPPAGEG